MGGSSPVRLGELVGRFGRTREGAGLRDLLRAGGTVSVGGLWGSAAGYVLAFAARRIGKAGARPCLAVTPDGESAEDLAGDLALFLGDPGAVEILPAFDSFRPGSGGPDPEVLGRRLRLLERILDGVPPAFLVAPAAALLQPVIAPDRLRTARRRVARGDRLDPGRLAGELARAGFRRTAMVEAPGEFAVRGGILDVFPLSGEAPWRVEFFDDEVESIRQFEPATQRSVARAEFFRITLLAPGEAAATGGRASLSGYLPGGHLLALQEEERIREWVAGVDARLGGAGLLRRWEAGIRSSRAGARLALSTRPPPPGERGVRVRVRSVSRRARSLSDLRETLGDLARENRRILLFANNEAERGRLEAMLEEAGDPARDRVAVEVGRLSGSFQLPGIRTAFLSHDEIFDRYRLRRLPRRPASAPVRDFVDLRPGDHVVHLAHGIGIYRGLTRLVKGGRTEEFLKVEFADSVIVYVPVTKANLVQRYIGTRRFRPRLSRVGGTVWRRRKARVKEAVKDLAADLLSIQAARRARPGLACPPDDLLQREFEASFLYEDTPDQVEVMEAIKEDMQAPRPMDRLLCGDVGYGKTELAIRAAFKTVAAGRQVAVLVPTTVLAQQHYQTFCERLVDYPVLVEMLSRFRSRREQKEIVERAAQGRLDILIGTHRLLSRDVRFRDLGLVIVDEEQRFGVEHKTRLRRLRRVVDVLTMTATPIPRTLHMALLGIKDISTLATPPPGRRAIRTEIIEFDPGIIRGAILREMNRGGQVFFVHNRIQTIDRFRRRLESIVPEARIAVVHGRMPEGELEKRMVSFVRGDVDVLLTTTIIESGLDIPNANTILIDRADRFGLSELHQLRGRVGRYRHRAYCYLILPRRRISTTAERRIRAVEEFQELGAGFRIAMRDLEIRGAGNILGTRQSGHIAAVGYELYCRLLEDAVKELREEPVPERVETFVELDVGARLASDYVPDERQKIELYWKLSRAASEEGLERIVEEAEDRFGPLPEEARRLVTLARIRIAASRLSVEHLVRASRDRVVLRPRDAGRLLRALAPIRDRVRVVDGRTVHLLLRDPAEDGPELLEDILACLVQGDGR